MTARAGRSGAGAGAGAIARALALATTRLGCGAGLAALVGPDPTAAAALIAGAVALDPREFAAPRPAGWRHVDPSWIDHALAGEGAAVRAVVTSDRDDPLARWLGRWFLGDLVPMPEPGPATTIDELPRLSARVLARTLAALGRRQLAHAVATAAAGDQAALVSRLPWGRALAGEIAAVRSLGDAAVGQLGSRRSAAMRTSGLAWTDPMAAVSAGLRTIAPSVRGRGDLAAQLAQRLPRAIGLPGLAELIGDFAVAPADTATQVEVQRAIAHGSVG